MKRAGKGAKGRTKPGVLPGAQAEVKYPPDSMIIVGKGLTDDETADAIAVHFAEYFAQMEELNAKHKR